MFVVQNLINITNDGCPLQTKSPNNMGAREFKKLNSFHDYHVVMLVLQRAPLLFIQNLFEMQNQQKRKNKPSVEQLAEIHNQLRTLHPNLKAIKVKRFYTHGRIIARAKLGHRQIKVNAHIHQVIERFVAQLEEKLPTSIFNF